MTGWPRLPMFDRLAGIEDALATLRGLTLEVLTGVTVGEFTSGFTAADGVAEDLVLAKLSDLTWFVPPLEACQALFNSINEGGDRR